MRVTKEAQERKNEILDTAEKLFAAKGYEAATINDILEAVKIAKGTFYYHFKSKEEVLDAIIERHINIGVFKAKEIIASNLSPLHKFLAIIMAQKPEDNSQDGLISVLHEKDNSKMHVKSLTQTVLHLSPCLAQVIKEGIEAGLYKTPFPLESAQILLTASMVLFDDDFFQWTDDEKAVKISAFLDIIERTLSAKPESFAEFVKAFY
jgi:AcrR family transcriptional regulator